MVALTERGYFDDSGTHRSSEVVVVGGLIGRPERWCVFEEQWGAKLADPLPEASKPALTKFGLADCNALKGEFLGYSEAEADAVTHDFRQILIGSGLIGFAAAIERKPWAELVMSRDPPPFKGDVEECVCKCIEELLSIAGAGSGSAAAIFDKGFWTPQMQTIAEQYTLSLASPQLVRVSDLVVADTYALQGADIVATENYWHAARVLKLGPDAQPRAHMRHYLDNMFHEGIILDRAGIETLVSSVGQPA
jgi:hypothetical protein